MAFDYTTITFQSRKNGVTFWGTDVNGTEKLILKDPTTGGTGRACFIHKIQMACGTSTAGALYDGSAGSMIVPNMASACGAAYSETWDFEKDPLVLINDSTESWVCFSGAATGQVHGMIKYSFGWDITDRN